MNLKEFIGIDISKETIDVHAYKVNLHVVFENNDAGFKSLLKWCSKNTKATKKQILFIFEHTGLYSYLLSQFLYKKGLNTSVVSGLEIKKSLGLIRGKSDKVDAKRIATYGYRMRDEIKLHTPPTKTITALKSLNTLRRKLVRYRTGLKSALKEFSRIHKHDFNDVLFDVQDETILFINEKVKQVEKEIRKLILNNEEVKKNYKLAISVKGVGPQAATNMIIYTENFTKFGTWRQFASYCGVAPFEHKSGTSVRGKTRVSHLANKSLKSILTMCSASAIQHNQELRDYYEKRIAKGKNRMSTLNIIKNKLIARVFAAVQRQTPYVNFMKFAS